MPTYSNGYIPDSMLVTFATGWSTNDGWWKHQLSPASYARHLALVKRAKDRTGRNLQITPGWGAYRPYAAQVLAKRLYGNGAAAPGSSSHGGFWENKQTLAIDYHNWGSVYGWNQGAWFADCRAVGLAPGMIMRSRGYPDEPWHVIDLTPWGSVPAFEGVFTPFPTEEDDMGTIDPTAANQQFIMDAVIKALSNWKVVDGDKNIFDGVTSRPVKQGVKDALYEFYLSTPTPPVGHETWPFFDFLIAAINRGDGAVDLDALAAKIRAGLGDDMVAELVRRLAA